MCVCFITIYSLDPLLGPPCVQTRPLQLYYITPSQKCAFWFAIKRVKSKLTFYCVIFDAKYYMSYSFHTGFWLSRLLHQWNTGPRLVPPMDEKTREAVLFVAVVIMVVATAKSRFMRNNRCFLPMVIVAAITLFMEQGTKKIRIRKSLRSPVRIKATPVLGWCSSI